MPFGVAIAYVAGKLFSSFLTRSPFPFVSVSLCLRPRSLFLCLSWSPLWLLEDAPKHGPSKLEDGNRTRAVFPNSAALHRRAPSLSHLPVPEREIMNGHRVSTAVSSVDIAGWPLVLFTLFP